MSRPRIARALALLFVVVTSALAGGRSNASEDAPRRVEPWPDEVVDLASRIPVQDQGRIKPLSSFAAFELLRIHGKRTLRMPDPEDPEEEIKLSPMEWMLDVLFYPEMARSYPLFRVEDRDGLKAVGLDTGEKRKRDVWSYDELFAVGKDLVEKGDKWSKIPQKDQTPLESQVVILADNWYGFHLLITRWDRLNLFPSAASDTSVRGWLSAPALSTLIAEGEASGLDEQRAQLEGIATLFDKRVEGMEVFAGAFEKWRNGVVSLSADTDETAKIDLEIAYYRADFFYRAQVLFILGFLVSIVSFLKRSGAGVVPTKLSRLHHVTRWMGIIPLLILIAGIVVRCVLRDRPPVSTLYETILFITAVAVLAALVTERINRQPITLLLAMALGSVGMFFAGWYEEISAADTMPKLQAVLDTNFWLSTHVTTVSMGYSAGILAAAVAHVYIIGKLLGLKRNDPRFYRNIGRMVYGIVCFGLVFSTVGTILGGVWANDSWGRFWGWDPKENGALMIVLVNLIILHARMGGYIRDWGLSLAAIFLGTVVAFSWFHVNLLAVGLHAYGFDARLSTLVWSYYSIEWGVLGLGILGYFIDRSRPNTPAAA